MISSTAVVIVAVLGAMLWYNLGPLESALVYMPGGAALLIWNYIERERIKRFEFEHRSSGGVIEFPSYGASKRHERARKFAFDGFWPGGAVICLCVGGLAAWAAYSGDNLSLKDRASGHYEANGIDAYKPPAPLVAARDGVRYRAAPDTSAEIVGVTHSGDALDITGRIARQDGTWFRVVLSNGAVGYIREDFTQPSLEHRP